MQTDETQTDESLGTTSEIEELGGCRRRMKASVPLAKVLEELDRNYSDLARTVQIPGFRKGRVPRQLLESRYGEEIESEVKESIVAASFSEVIEEKELQVFSSPKFENVTFDRDSDLTYEVEFEVRPDFELPEYKGVEVAAGTAELSDEDVAAELEKLQQQMATLEPVKPKDIGTDGYLGGSYTLFIEGREVKKVDEVTFQPSTGTLEQFHIEDLPARIADWHRTPEAPLSFEVTVPAHYPDEVLRGKDARLELVVSDGYRRKLPDLDEEFARKSNHESLEELKTEMRESLQKRRQREVELGIEDRILEKLAGLTDIEVPEALVEAQLRRSRMNQEQLLLEQGFTGEQVAEFFAEEAADEEADGAPDAPTSGDVTSGEEEPSAAPTGGDANGAPATEDQGGGGTSTTEEIRQSAKKYFILEAIAEKEKIFVTEQTVDARLAQMAQYYGMAPERLRVELEKTGRLNELRQTLKHDKVREFLRSKAKIVGPDASPQEVTDVSRTGDGTETEGGA